MSRQIKIVNKKTRQEMIVFPEHFEQLKLKGWEEINLKIKVKKVKANG